MLTNGINYNNMSDAVGLALSSYLTEVVATQGIAGLAPILETTSSVVLGVGLLAVSVYACTYFLTEINNSINIRYGSMNYWVDVYNWVL